MSHITGSTSRASTVRNKGHLPSPLIQLTRRDVTRLSFVRSLAIVVPLNAALLGEAMRAHLSYFHGRSHEALFGQGECIGLDLMGSL